jgi:hypothetical protein
MSQFALTIYSYWQIGDEGGREAEKKSLHLLPPRLQRRDHGKVACYAFNSNALSSI